MQINIGWQPNGTLIGARALPGVLTPDVHWAARALSLATIATAKLDFFHYSAQSVYRALVFASLFKGALHFWKMRDSTGAKAKVETFKCELLDCSFPY